MMLLVELDKSLRNMVVKFFASLRKTIKFPNLVPVGEDLFIEAK